MNTGILWFDDSKDSLEVKIKKAFDYYVKKYGQEPNLVLANPSDMMSLYRDVPTAVENHNKPIAVRMYKQVLPGHIWIGMEDEKEGGDNGKKETT